MQEIVHFILHSSVAVCRTLFERCLPSRWFALPTSHGRLKFRMLFKRKLRVNERVHAHTGLLISLTHVVCLPRWMETRVGEVFLRHALSERALHVSTATSSYESFEADVVCLPRCMEGFLRHALRLALHVSTLTSIYFLQRSSSLFPSSSSLSYQSLLSLLPSVIFFYFFVSSSRE